MIDQRLTIVTLGVQDLKKATEFYEQKFGWKKMNEEETITFFKLNGMLLGLFPQEELAKDIGVKNDSAGLRRFTLAINMNSEQEVDETIARLKEKGVEVVKPPQKVFWGGYSGYVKDIDGNHWEIAYNPFMKMDEYGNVIK